MGRAVADRLVGCKSCQRGGSPEAPLHLPARPHAGRPWHLPPSAVSLRARPARLGRRPHRDAYQLHARDGAGALRRKALRARAHRRRSAPLGLGVLGRAPLPPAAGDELRDVRHSRGAARRDAPAARRHLGVVAAAPGRERRRGPGEALSPTVDPRGPRSVARVRGVGGMAERGHTALRRPGACSASFRAGRRRSARTHPGSRRAGAATRRAGRPRGAGRRV